MCNPILFGVCAPFSSMIQILVVQILYSYIEETHFQTLTNSLIIEHIHVGFCYSLLRSPHCDFYYRRIHSTLVLLLHKDMVMTSLLLL
jgi:hypothetical protein